MKKRKQHTEKKQRETEDMILVKKTNQYFV